VASPQVPEAVLKEQAGCHLQVLLAQGPGQLQLVVAMAAVVVPQLSSAVHPWQRPQLRFGVVAAEGLAAAAEGLAAATAEGPEVEHCPWPMSQLVLTAKDRPLEVARLLEVNQPWAQAQKTCQLFQPLGQYTLQVVVLVVRQVVLALF